MKSNPRIINPSSATGDNRAVEREKTYRAADVILGDGKTPIAASLLDLSKHGLRLYADTPVRIPKYVTVILSHPASEHACELIWQKDNEIGLKFIS
jgi:hypothetical protein